MSRVEWDPRNPEVMGMQALVKLCRDREVLQALSPTCACHCALPGTARLSCRPRPSQIFLKHQRLGILSNNIHPGMGGRELAAGLPRAGHRRLRPAPVQLQSTAEPGQPWKRHSMILGQKEAEMQLN